MNYFVGRPINQIDIMALGAVSGEAIGLVIGLGRGVIIIQVATDAIIADTIKPQVRLGYMAIKTACGRMRAHKRKSVILMEF